MLGTLFNVATVTVGSLLGITLKARLPQRIITTVFQILGIFTIFLGFESAFESNNSLLVLLAVIIGGILGELFNLEARTERLVDRFKSDKQSDEHFTKGLMTAFILFCIGALTVLGCFDEGILGDRKRLITKSIMDLFSSTALAAAFGRGVLFSIIPLFLYQAGLTLGASYLAPYLNEGMQHELSAAGGLLLIALGFNILNLTKIRVINLLPALVVVVLFTFLAQKYGFYELSVFLN
jgi:uncharacterized protein